MQSSQTNSLSHRISLKQKYYFEDFFIIGCTGSCHPDNFQCSQWWRCHHNENVYILGMNMVIGIDHDTVCAGVVGTAIRNSTSCAGRRAAACGRAGRHNECCSGLQYQPRQRRPYKWSISILPRSQFTKSKGNLRFRRLVPLFVPIDVCVTTHDDGTASDVTIGMWRHNQQVTNHERNGKPWFSLPK